MLDIKELLFQSVNKLWTLNVLHEKFFFSAITHLWRHIFFQVDAFPAVDHLSVSSVWREKEETDDSVTLYKVFIAMGGRVHYSQVQPFKSCRSSWKGANKTNILYRAYFLYPLFYRRNISAMFYKILKIILVPFLISVQHYSLIPWEEAACLYRGSGRQWAEIAPWELESKRSRWFWSSVAMAGNELFPPRALWPYRQSCGAFAVKLHISHLLGAPLEKVKTSWWQKLSWHILSLRTTLMHAKISSLFSISESTEIVNHMEKLFLCQLLSIRSGNSENNGISAAINLRHNGAFNS